MKLKYKHPKLALFLKIILIIFISIFPFITSFFVNVTYTKKNVTQIKTHVTKSKIQVSFIAYCLLND